MKKIIVLFLLWTSGQAMAQEFEFEKPDYKTIARETSDKKSPYFFDSLMRRYQRADTSLTVEDFRFLYYGYTYQSEYSPDSYPDYLDSLSQVMNQEELAASDYQLIIGYIKHILDEKPFNIEELNLLAYAYEQKGDSALAQDTMFKLTGVVEAILSSGDGLSEQTAWHVIEVSHEYDVLEIIGLESAGIQSLTGEFCDKIELQLNDYGLDAVFYDVRRLFIVRSERMGLD